MKDEFDAAETEKFNSKITEYRNGKIVAYIQVSDSTHEIFLISNNLSVWKACTGKIAAIQDLREKLKKSIVSHIISTVNDQSRKGILLEFEAAFNMAKSINSSTCISYIKELCTTDRLNYTHKIKWKGRSSPSTQNFLVNWNDYFHTFLIMTLPISAKLISLDTLIKQFCKRCCTSCYS